MAFVFLNGGGLISQFMVIYGSFKNEEEKIELKQFL